MMSQFQPRRGLRAALAAALLLAVLAGCREDKLAIGEPAPALAATDPAGEPASLDTWRGRPLFLTFWSDGCSSCVAEMKELETLAQANGGRVAVVAVNVDAESPDLREIRQRLGLSFPLLQDSLGISKERYDVAGTPTSVLIDARGRILSHYVGMRKPDELAGDFAALNASTRSSAAPGT
jgi:peroxiredoxin